MAVRRGGRTVTIGYRFAADGAIAAWPADAAAGGRRRGGHEGGEVPETIGIFDRRSTLGEIHRVHRLESDTQDETFGTPNGEPRGEGE